MNITEYAALMGTSKTTLYRKINAAGIDVESLRGEDGQLTNDGMTVLSALLDGTLQRRKPSQVVDAEKDGVNLLAQVTTLQEQIDTLQEQLTTAQERIAELQAENNVLLKSAADRERQHADELRDILHTQQEISKRQLLTAQAGADGRGLFGRIHDALFGKKAQTGAQSATEHDQN